jgi:ABC-type Mn2+/Zn2+ transport system ATPase subunit
VLGGAGGRRRGRGGGEQGRGRRAGGGSAERGAPPSSVCSPYASPYRTNHPLCQVSVAVRPGECVGVCGPVGTGKSTLLLALLGELDPMRGRVQPPAPGAPVAYAPQAPWIFPGTLRDNVLLGRPFEPAWFAAVLAASALDADLAKFPAGDLTWVGERGVTLSGGQKQRVSLARCAYARAPVAVLDDPLAALDARVRAHVLRDCVLGLMRRGGAALVVAAHDPAVLGQCDRVLAVSGGGIADVSAEHAAGALGAPGAERAGSGAAPGGAAGGDEDAALLAGARAARAGAWDDAAGEAAGAGAGESLADFWRHFLLGCGGYARGGAALALIALEAGMVEVGVFFLAEWSGAGLTDPKKANERAREYWMPIYVACVAAEVSLCAARNLAYVEGTAVAVRALHDRLSRALVHAPLSYLEGAQSGGVIHLFSQEGTTSRSPPASSPGPPPFASSPGPGRCGAERRRADEWLTHGRARGRRCSRGWTWR